MKLLITIALLTFSYACVFSQSVVLYDGDSLKVMVVEGSDTLRHIEPSFYSTRKKNKRARLLYLNDHSIDSSGLDFRNYPWFYSGQFRSCYETFPEHLLKIYEFKIGNVPTEVFASKNFVPITYHFGTGRDGSNNKVFKLSDSGQLKIFSEFDHQFEYYETLRARDEVWGLTEMNDDEVIVESCVWDGGCSYYRYFHVSPDTLYEMPFINLRKDVQIRTAKENEYFRVNFYFSHSQYDFLMASIDYGNLAENTDLILSKNLIDTTHIIKKSKNWKVVGENIQKNKNQFFYLRSTLDNQKKVIVSYKINKTFEKSAYQIFKGHPLSKNQLKDFDGDQLGILKNLVFAKYNYTFESEFYQAYFNLFEFYNDEKKRANRTKNMNGLLAKKDLDNLEVIKKVLKNLGKH